MTGPGRAGRAGVVLGARALVAALVVTFLAVPASAADPAPAPAPETVTIATEPPAPARVGATWSPRATSSIADRVPVVTVAADPAEACTLTGAGADSTITFAAAGTCTVTATTTADATHAGGTDERVVTMTRRPRTVTIDGPAAGEVLRVGTPWTPTTSSNPAGTIELTASPSTHCTTSGTAVTLLAPGGCRVTASAAQSTAVEQAEDHVDITIERRTRTVSIADASGLLAGTIWDPVITSSPTGPATFTSLTRAVCVPVESDTRVSLVAGGRCRVSATVAQDDTTQATTSAVREVTVARQSRTVTLPAPAASLYADTVWNPGAVTTGAGTPTYAVTPENSTICQPSSDATRVRLLRSGTCTVTASVAADATHQAGSSASRSVSVLAQVPTLTFSVLPIMPRWTDLVSVMVSATDADGDRVAGRGLVRVAGVDSADPAATTWTDGSTTRTFTGSGAGVVEVTASFTPTQTTVYAATSKTEPVTLGRATQSASFGTPTDDQRYVGERWPNAASLTSGLTPVLDAKTGTCTVTGNAVDFTGSGTCTVGASHPGTSDYDAAPEATTDVVVRKRPTRLTASLSASPTVGRPVTITARASDLLQPAASADPVPGVFTFDVPGQSGTTSQATPAAGAATYTYTPSQDGPQPVTVRFTPTQSARFAAPADVSSPVEVVAAPQEVTFDTRQLPAQRYVDDQLTVVLGGTAGGGGLSLAVDASQGPVACSVAGFTLTWTRAGTCHLIGRQAAVPRVYAAAALPIAVSTVQVPVDVRAGVRPAAGGAAKVGEVVEVRAAARDGRVADSPPLVEGSGTLGVERQTAAGTWTAVAERASSAWNRGTRLLTFTPAKAGTYRVVEGFVPDNGTRYLARRTGPDAVALPEFSVDRGSQVLRFVNPLTDVLVDATPWRPASTSGASSSPVVVSVTDDQPTEQVCTSDGTTVQFTAAGTCTVTLSQDEDLDYTAATPVSRDVVVSRAPTTVSLAPASTTPTVGSPLTVVIRAAGPGGSLVPGTFVVDRPGLAPASVVSASGRIEVPWVPPHRGVQSVSASFSPQRSASFADGGGSVELTVRPGTQSVSITGTVPVGALVGDRFDPRVVVTRGPLDPLVPSVALTTSDEDVCAVDGTAVLLTGPGTCSVTARAVAFPLGSTSPDWIASDPATTPGFGVARNGVTVSLTAPNQVRVGVADTAVVTVSGSRGSGPLVVPGTIALAAVSQSTGGSTPVAGGTLDESGRLELPLLIGTRDGYDLVATFTPTDATTWAGGRDVDELDAVLRSQSVLPPTLPATPVRVFSTWDSPNLSDAGLPVQVEAIDSVGVCSIVAGTGSRTVSFDGPGSCSLRFTATGDQTTYEDADNSFDERVEVSRTPSTTTLTVDGVAAPTGLTVGEGSRLRAVVSAAAAGDRVAGGEVVFEETGATGPIGPPTVLAVVELVNGRAETPWLPRHGGARTVSARFVPDASSTAGYDASADDVSSSVALAPMSSSVSVTHRPSTSDADDVVIDALLAPVRAAAGPATGSVVFRLDGGRTLGTVPLSGGAARLTTSIDSGRTVTVLAEYAGDADHLGTAARVVRGVPTLTARTRPGEATRGWNGSAVRVEFSCRSAGAPLVGPCPGTVVLDEDGASQSVSRTVVAVDGGRATAGVRGIDVDLTPPSVTILGARDGQDFRGRSPVTRCQARDATSGVSRCRFTRTSVDRDTVLLSATATDGAGHSTTSTVRYRQLQEWVVDAPLDESGRFRVSGRRVEVRALSPRERPQLLLPGPGPGGGWRPGPALVPTSIRDGVITWYVDHRLPAGRADTRLGVRVAGQQIRVLRITR